LKERAFQIAGRRKKQDGKDSQFISLLAPAFAGMIDALTVPYRAWAKRRNCGREI